MKSECRRPNDETNPQSEVSQFGRKCWNSSFFRPEGRNSCWVCFSIVGSLDHGHPAGQARPLAPGTPRRPLSRKALSSGCLRLTGNRELTFPGWPGLEQIAKPRWRLVFQTRAILGGSYGAQSVTRSIFLPAAFRGFPSVQPRPPSQKCLFRHSEFVIRSAVAASTNGRLSPQHPRFRQLRAAEGFQAAVGDDLGEARLPTSIFFDVDNYIYEFDARHD